MPTIHVDGKIVYANRAFVRTLGCDALDEIVGKPLVDFVDPRARAPGSPSRGRPLRAPSRR